MLTTIEELYYALFARLNIEIGNVQLCDGFRFDMRRMAGTAKRDDLPEHSHLSLIFLACREVLMSEEVYGFLDRELIRQHQAHYVRWAIEKSAREGYYPKDQLGYRQYILRLVANPSSPAFLRWYGVNTKYKLAPAAALAALSEKYLTILPKSPEVLEHAAKRRDSTTYMEDPETQERLRALANREASSSMLNGITVGEFRRIEGTLPLKEYAARRMCICFNFCVCARECTRKAARTCPCSARMSVICANQETEPKRSFVDRYGDLAEAIFEGLCVTRKGITAERMAAELKTGLDLFHEEVIDYRREHTKMSLK